MNVQELQLGDTVKTGDSIQITCQFDKAITAYIPDLFINEFGNHVASYLVDDLGSEKLIYDDGQAIDDYTIILNFHAIDNPIPVVAIIVAITVIAGICLLTIELCKIEKVNSIGGAVSAVEQSASIFTILAIIVIGFIGYVFIKKNLIQAKVI